MKIKDLLRKVTASNISGIVNYRLKEFDGYGISEYTNYTEEEIQTLLRWVEVFPEAEVNDKTIYHSGKFYELAEQGGFKQVTTVITTKYWTVDELLKYGR